MVEILIKNDIILTIGSKESGEVVDTLAQQMDKKVRAHIKIDTGFGRYGFIYNKKEEMIKLAKTYFPNSRVEVIKDLEQKDRMTFIYVGDGFDE